MEPTVVSHLFSVFNGELAGHEQALLAIIPTIVIPFAFLGFLLNALAAVIAGFFGIHLKTEGPKRLLEVLLHKKVLLSALFLNAVMWGGYHGYNYWKHLPSPVFWIEKQNAQNPPSVKKYEDVLNREIDFTSSAEAKTVTGGIEEAWRLQLPAGVFNSPVLSGGSIFVGTKDGYVYEIDAEKGEIFRRFFVGTHITPQPLISRGFLYVGEGIHPTHHARVYKFDLMTGKLSGTFATKGHTEGTPSIVERDGVPILLVAAGSDGVYGVNAETMREIWHQPLTHADSGFADNGRWAFFSTGVEKGENYEKARFAYALDPSTGAVQWRRQLAISGWMPPVFYQEQVCFGLGEIYLESDHGQLSCLNQADGRPVQTYELNAPVTSLLQVSGDRLALGLQNGEVCAFDLAAHRPLWCRTTTEGEKGVHTFASPVFFGRNVLYPSFKDGLYLLDGDTGAELLRWKAETLSQVHSRPLMTQDGWYLSDYAGNLLKLVPPTRKEKPVKNAGSLGFLRK